MASETFTVEDDECHGCAGNSIQIEADTSFSDCPDSSWTFVQDVLPDAHVEGERVNAYPHDFGFESLEFEHSGETEKSACGSSCPSPSTPAAGSELHFESTSNAVQPVTSDSQWQLGVIANHGQFSQHQTSLLLPWESGVFAEIFGKGSLLELPQSHLPEPDSEFMEKVIEASESLASTLHELPLHMSLGMLVLTKQFETSETLNTSRTKTDNLSWLAVNGWSCFHAIGTQLVLVRCLLLIWLKMLAASWPVKR